MEVRKNHIIENNIEKEHCPTCNEWKELIEFNKQFFIHINIKTY